MLDKLIQWLQRMREHVPVKHPLDEDTMLKYFLSEIDVRVRAVAPRIKDDLQKNAYLDEIRQSLFDFFKKEQFNRNHNNLVDDAWNEAYRLERMLALVEPDDTLVTEI